ncbi:MAG: hypothetical protein ACRDGB_13175, partial [Candidatus Limnocylindria bacterium]
MSLRIGVLVLALVVGVAACSAPPAQPTLPAVESMPTAAEPSPSSTVAATPPNQPSPSASAAAADPLLAMELVDVRDGTTFTLADLAVDRPLIVETMAIWCSNCRQQQG